MNKKIEEAKKRMERTACKYCGEEISFGHNSWADGFPGGWCTVHDNMLRPWCPNAPEKNGQHEPVEEMQPAPEPEQEIRGRTQSIPEEAYFDRNQAAMAIGKCAQILGYPVGIKPDEDWPILYVDLPTGQVSWHLPARELLGSFPVYGGEWDGHDLSEKRERLRKFIQR